MHRNYIMYEKEIYKVFVSKWYYNFEQKLEYRKKPEM